MTWKLSGYCWKQHIINLNKTEDTMKELDDNQKARLADYLNGRTVDLTDEELNMLAEDDELANECLMIAEVADDAQTAQVKKEVKTFRMNLVWISVAACLVFGVLVAVFHNDNSQTPSVAVMQQDITQKGYNELSSASRFQTASVKGDFFSARPDVAFDIEPAQQDKVTDNDIVKVFVSENANPIYETKVISKKVKDKTTKKVKKVKMVKFADGFAQGVYSYKIYHDNNIVDRGGFMIGEEDAK